MSAISSEIPTSSEAINGGLLSDPFVFKANFYPPGMTLSSRVVIPISGPNFQYGLEAELVSAELIGADKFVAKFTVDESVDFILTLLGRPLDQGKSFEAGQFSLNYHISQPRPRAHFVASTLMAIFALAGGFQLKIPELEIDQKLNIVVPLLEISRLLKSRQMALRLMVIEKATGVEFLLPPGVPLADKASLEFVYHAIVDRSFVWHRGKVQATLSARSERLAEIPSTQPFLFPYVSDPFYATILGNSISLGRATITIEDAVIKNLDAVRRELETNDGHDVKFEIESLSGQERYEFPEAPHIPVTSWDSKIRDLIDLDPQLDSALFGIYNDLAAATLEGLSDEQKAAVTARPELDEEAFSI